MQMDELYKRIANTDPEIVRHSPTIAKKVYNECRKKMGLDSIKFEDVEVE